MGGTMTPEELGKTANMHRHPYAHRLCNDPNCKGQDAETVNDDTLIWTPELRGKVVAFARMFLHYAEKSTGVIANIRTGKSQTPMQYANEFLSDLGVGASFHEPDPPRDISKLQVVDAKTGDVLKGKPTKWLEEKTRQHPDEPVKAVKNGNYWVPGNGWRDAVEVRVVPKGGK